MTSKFSPRKSLEERRGMIRASLLGKAYIAVLKHKLSGDSRERSFREVFDEAYRLEVAKSQHIEIAKTQDK